MNSNNLSTQSQPKNGDGNGTFPLSQTEMKKREIRQRLFLLAFASFSTFFYAGGVYGWGPMQLLLEENGNFASRCNDGVGLNDVTINISSTSSSTTTTTEDLLVCPDQTEAFLTCKFVSQLTLLSGTTWGFLSDRYGKKVLTSGFCLCNIVGLVLLLVGIQFPIPVVEDLALYGAFILMGLASTVGGMLTVETGILFKSDQKQQNRVISFLNALFDAGAMAYLGLWGLEKLTSSSTDASGNMNLTLIIAGFLVTAFVFLGGYTYFFHVVEAKNCDLECVGTMSFDRSSSSDEEATGEAFREEMAKVQIASNTSVHSTDTHDGEVPTCAMAKAEPLKEEECAPSQLYTPIAKRAANDQMKSKAYILLGIWFSFHSTSNHWTLTTARDFLGMMGDDEFGNRYLGIFTLLTPFSIIALPFLDTVINRFGFHAALQSVNALGIIHGIIKVWIRNLDIQIIGFVVFTFFRCFLYSVGLSCAASFIGPTAIGKATGTLYVLAGITSFFNIGLAHWAMEEGDFFLPNLMYLMGTVPMIYLTYDLGKALNKDQSSKN